ncbi:MAG: Ig-like domain-containing protein, partial [Bacteroidota bacterium]
MRYYSLFLFVPVALFSGCAGQRPPEGGPVDSTPPEIISVYPAPQTTHFNDSKVVFEFSEYVDRRSVEEAIFISPSIEQKEFKWSGTEVELYFLEELKKNTTYVITVGTDVRDVRAGNRMAKSYSLSFS